MTERSPSPDWATSSPVAQESPVVVVPPASPPVVSPVKEGKGPEPRQNEDVAAEILKSIFGEVGELVSDYTCAIESNILLHGRMYVTNKFICFYSNLFGLEKKIRIPYQHITSITKEMTAVVIPNAIAVTTQRKQYIFRSFWDRDDCFATLSSLLQRHKESPGARDSVVTVSDERSRGNSVISVETGSPAAAQAAGSALKAAAPAVVVKAAPAAETEIDSINGRQELDAAAAQPGIEVTPAVVIEVSPEDHKKQLLEEVEKSKLKLPICSDKLKCTVDKFEKMFILESAPHGWLAYHKLMKDENLDPSGWSEEATSLGHAREIKFLKPVNLPGLASTRAKKLQRYRRFGDAGLIVCSSTSMEDVPSADSFSVEDMVVVTDIGNGEVHVDVSMEVKFIKSTMFRRLIESNTNSEVTKWLLEFFKYLQKCCEEPADPTKKKKKEKKTLHVQPPPPPPKLGILESLNHELNNIDFAGNKWKSVSEILHKQSGDIEELLRLTRQLAQTNTEYLDMLSKHK